MLITYIKSASGALQSANFEQTDPAQIVWIDLIHPTQQEEMAVESALGISIPTRDEMREIEQSSRLYEENEVVYATAMVLVKSDTHEPESHAISFVLTPRTLITVRYSEPKSFEMAAARMLKYAGTGATVQLQVFLTLCDAVVDRLADVLENVGRGLDKLGRSLFRPAIIDKKARVAARPDYDAALREIGVLGDTLSKARESLISLSRMVSYVSQHGHGVRGPEDMAHIQELLGDVVPLGDHAGFLANKVTFLLDAALGMIGMEQNGTIKIFSVVAVVFLPPTLIASIYGMNFQHMPELGSMYGYPLALAGMLLAAWLPYHYFKWKKWL